jgi:hypothetical protein
MAELILQNKKQHNNRAEDLRPRKAALQDYRTKASQHRVLAEGHAVQGEVAQLQRYNRSIDIDLTTAEKVYDAKPEISGKQKAQPGVVRARGFEIGELRKQYPLPAHVPKPTSVDEAEKADMSRGAEFSMEYAQIMGRYEGEQDTAGKYAVKKPAVFTGAPERGRNGSIAENINVLMHGQPEYIGAHLVKREWGGTDNMWNVVAWTLKAEHKWARGFEMPIDVETARGNAPGRIQILVQKEDEVIKESDTPQQPGGEVAPEIDATRLHLNKALESVPMHAEGKGNYGGVALNINETGFTAAELEAQRELVKVAHTHTGKQGNNAEVDKGRQQYVADRKALRREHWNREMVAYEGTDKQGSGFLHNNPLI